MEDTRYSLHDFPLMGPLEILHCPFVFFGRFSGVERSQISPPSGSRILFA
jgi:hypothetical protein